MNVTMLMNVTTPGPANTAGYVEALQTMFLAGWFWKLLKVTGPTSALLTAFNSFMFNVGIPALAFKGLAIQKFSALPWSYIAVFFCLRAALFVLFLLFGLAARLTRHPVSLADVTMYWQSSTWINTVIFGIPIYVALFGPQFAVFPIFASISSFFFQLPLQLIVYELERKRHPIIPTIAPEKSIEEWWMSSEFDMKQLTLPLDRFVLKLCLSILLNPIIIAIVGGVLFSLTGWTLPVYLNNFCTYTGDAVTPMAAFAIGVFACKKPPADWTLWLSVFFQVIVVKFFIMPLLVMPFLLAFGIVGIPRQMGVLMAALPVALSCYVLSVKYRLQVDQSAMVIIVSTILMLPTQLMWIGITASMGW